MRTSPFPRGAFAALLGVLLPLTIASCSDGGTATEPDPPAATPTIAIALSATSLELAHGENGSVTVTVTRGGGFTGAVGLSLEGAASGLSGTFSPSSVPANERASTLSLTVSQAAAAGTHNLTARATGQGVEDKTASLAVAVVEAASIALSVDPDALGLDQGTSGTVEIAVTRTNFSGPIQLSLEEPPDGVSGAFDPESVPADADRSTLTFEVAEDAPAGESELVLRASGEEVEDRTVPLVLTISEAPDYKLTLDPDHLTLSPGERGSTTLTVSRYCHLMELSIDGLPEGASVDMRAFMRRLSRECTARVPDDPEHSDVSLLLEVVVGVYTEPGTYTVTLRGQVDGLADRTAVLELTVLPTDGFSLDVTPTSLVLERGQTGTAAVTVARTGDFAGAVGLSFEGGSGVSGTFSPATISPDASGSTLTIEVAGNAALGSRDVVVTASGDGAPQRTATLSLTIEDAASYTLALDPSSLSVAQGGSGSTTILIDRFDFTATIALSMSGVPSDVTASVDPAMVSGEEATLTVQAVSWAAPGSYALTVTGQAAGHTDRTAELELTITEVGTSVSWARVVAGRHHSCGITVQGDAYCWGRNDDGQLGDGNDEPALRPVLVRGGHEWVDIGIGHSHSCGLTTDGTAYCWGSGLRGRLGTGTTASSTTPVPVSGGHTFQRLGVGAEHTCAITTSGDAYCWGDGGFRSTGNPESTPDVIPRLISGGHAFKALGAGWFSNCAITAGETTYCWGLSLTRNDRGTAVPVELPGGHAFAGLSLYYRHACAWTETGAGYCWGLGQRGQLGSGENSTAPMETPILVVGGHAFAQISAGENHTCAVTGSGAGYCWGWGSGGMLGTGDSASSGTPRQVTGGLTFDQVSTGNNYTCGVTADGAAYCWGSNTRGALGHPPVVSTLVPLRVMDPE